MNQQFERIEKSICSIGGRLSPAHSVDMEIEDDEGNCSDEDAIAPEGDSANTATPENTSVTATRPSPTKKQKGDQGSDTS